MDDVAASLEKAGYRCIKLDVAFAFHSDQLNPILDDFEEIAMAGVIFQEPKVPVISPLLGKVIFDGKTMNASYVRRVTRQTVDFVAALEQAQKIHTISDETVWIEIGPHPVCTNFIKTTIPSTRLAVPSMRRGDDNWKTITESMATLHICGVEVGWNEFHSPLERRLRLLDLPAYAWNEKNHWIQYTVDWCLTKSDLMQEDLLAATHGHSMNNCGVVTSSIHADIAYTLGNYLYRKLNPKSKEVHMNTGNLVVTKGLVAQTNKKTPQLFRVTATTADVGSGLVELAWQNVDNDGGPEEPFATANICYEDASKWLSSWQLPTSSRAELKHSNTLPHKVRQAALHATCIHPLQQQPGNLRR
ncbi:polyketide synthase, putative [Talaromyces stipitatus ATCC 10500]|uniref:Polyketide synthase, putative n=1 Tax=Talaromyces stipitatus (strain ATCC 10500 / CBS 375.48 / QM 6759 / NRRL 1006) TaxID=441959 RepID=B8MLT3_TALSN|nr:polyketide synthase, putative [Talaromyces stipitatus ATCC 10500]EED13800.1 polyketide synthase, putative [Talaromyces stipitatus ATCC 10500]